MTTDPRQLLDHLDALHAASSPGPWEAELCEGELTVSAGTARTEWTQHEWGKLGVPAFSYRSTDRIYEHTLETWDAIEPDDQQREADADLIVAAVNALPQLTSALRAVLALHQRERGPWDSSVCTHCMTAQEEQQEWPCPTVQAVTAALSPPEPTAEASPQ